MPGSIALLSTDLARVELFTAGASRPEVLPPGEACGNARDYRRRATEVAQWLASQPTARKRFAAVVLDVDESLCRWIKGASAAPPVLTAALKQQQQEWGDSGYIGLVEPVTDSRPARAGGSIPFAGLFKKKPTLDPDDPAGDEALNDDALTAAAPTAPIRGSVAIALPDALPRLVLDGLDKQGVKVNAAISLWHALALLSAHIHDKGSGSRQGSGPEQGDAEPIAVLAIEPGRRLVWAWALRGRLLAGGSVPLEHHAAPASAEPKAADASPHERTARRLMLDWLSWSAQLGFVPSSVQILGPTGSPLTDTLCNAFRASDPSATINTENHDNGVLATLHKLTTLPRPPASIDARQSLARLSARPNRATRQRYFTTAAALLLIATAIAGLGYRFGQQASAWSQRVAEVNAQTLQAAAPLVPAARSPNSGMTASAAESELNTQLAELRAQPDPRSLREPKDVAAALDRALNILERYEGTITIDNMRFSDLSETLGSRGNTITLTVPDLRTALEIFDAFQKEDPAITWERSTGRGRPENQLLLEGSWRP